MNKISICLILALFLSPIATKTSKASLAKKPEYRLHLYHLHSAEHIDLIYRRGNEYVPEAIQRLSRFLRDHRTGTVHPVDPRLFDLLYALNTGLGQANAEIDIVCGYRTPSSNSFLRRTTAGVAAHSLHMEGEAIDIRIPGVRSAKLRDVALSLERGGVGYYPQSNFVHVDVGRVRKWQH